MVVLSKQMFSAVTHVLKEAANGAMYLVGASETTEAVEDDQPIVLSNDELKPVVEPAPETVQATPAPPAVPPPPVSVIPPASAPPAEKEETKHDEESGDEFDLSKWKK